ncbi:LysR family transcriptional regulator substrate-binding protein [Brevibacillus sp. B_LB10_24]|uniref:LysR family transcriptional regulator substrate-binding protein n=1 Tax=Brevibacillus sp. B_LB10_24 TaxID=3380645 RepID=UPI0038BDF4ED
MRKPLNDTQLEIKEVVEVHDCFIAGPSFAQLKGRTISLSELLAAPLILLEEGSISRQYINRYFQRYGYDIVTEFELGNLDLLVEFARIGLGVACITREFIDYDRSPMLFELELEEQIPPRKIGIIKLKHSALSQAAQTFIDSFLTICSKD